MAQQLWVGASAIAFIVGLGLAAAWADPTEAPSEQGFGGAMGEASAPAGSIEPVGSVAVISDQELGAGVSNVGGVGAARQGGCAQADCWQGDAEAAAGGASQGNYQAPLPAGGFNNALGNGVGGGQVQGTIATTIAP